MTQAGLVVPKTGLETLGLKNPGNVYWNLTVPTLYEEAIRRGEGQLGEGGAFVVRTGVLRPTLGARGSEVVTTYAVCPLCHYRQDFAGKPSTLKCVRCGATSPVDWSETC